MILLILLLMCVSHTQVANYGISYKVYTSKAVAYFTMGYIIFWASLRTQFVDTAAYISGFNEANTGVDEAIQALFQEGKQKGFDFLQILFKTFFSESYHWWLTLIAVATGVPIMMTLRKYSVNYLYSMYLFVTSMIVVWMFNGIRQFVVAAIMFGLCDLIIKRKTILFIVAVFLCSTVHTTILIMLPVYFIVFETPFKRKMMLFVLLILMSVFAISPLLETMETVLHNTAYASNLGQFAEDDGVNPLRVLFKAIPVVLAFIRRKQIEKTNNQFINICINMTTISVGIYVIGIFTSGIMIGRLPIYFDLYSLILIPYLFSYVYIDMKKQLYWGLGLLYLLFYFLMSGGLYYNSELTGFIK